jgi:hypothetical protein
MKMFVWRGGNVLRNYSSGMAVAFAESVDQARELLRQPIIDDVYDWLTGEWMDDDDREQLVEKMSWLDKEPEVYDTPSAVWVRCGE